MKYKKLLAVFALMTVVTAVRSGEYRLYTHAALPAAVQTQSAPFYGKVTKISGQEITLQTGTIDFAGDGFEADNAERLIKVTDTTVFKDAKQTEGEVSSFAALQTGDVIAVMTGTDPEEAAAVTVMTSVIPVPAEEETEEAVPEEDEETETGAAVTETDGKKGDAPASGKEAAADTDASDKKGADSDTGEPSGTPGEPSGTPGQPPEKPEGEPAGMGGAGNGSGEPMGQPPEKPEGEPAGMSGAGNGPGGPMEGPGMPGSGPEASGVDSYEAVREYSESAEITGEEIISTGIDENALLVDEADASVKVTDSEISRTSSESTGQDTASFYGVGSAALVTDGELTVENCSITTDADGAAGVFAYGDGTARVNDTTIRTGGNTSGGIHAAGGGTLYAQNLDVVTDGASSAAIRSDRGGGTMVIDGGSYTSNGLGSPSVYCTADITVHDAGLNATGSEAVCIEGRNTLRLFDCSLTGAMTDQDQNDNTWNVIVYQSMSGDSVEGNGTFEMSGGTLKAENGGMFYTTNTESTITLKDVDIENAENAPFFLQVTGNSNARGWGEAGNNGADCLFTAISQEMEGDVIWDSISRLDFYLTDHSLLTGAFVQDETWAGAGGSGSCSVTIDADSVWEVTGDSTITTLYCVGTIRDVNGESVTILGSDGTVYAEGDSPYTITTDHYEETADVAGASVMPVWEDYSRE